MVSIAAGAKRALDALQSQHEKLLSLKCGLMRDLLTGKVPVCVRELVVTA